MRDQVYTQAMFDPLVTTHLLYRLRKLGVLKDRDVRDACESLEPRALEWRAFLQGTALTLGALGIGLGVIFIVAANWQEFGRFARMGLVAALISACCALAAVRGTQHPVSHAALFVAALAVGALLAVLGQTYHTGSGVEKLLLIWALLILPWAWASDRTPLYALAWVLWNASAAIGLPGISGVLFFGIPDFTLQLAALALSNALFVGLLELFRPDWRWLRSLPLAAALAALTVNTCLVIVDAESLGALSLALLLIHPLALAASLWFYRYRRFDLSALALLCLSAIACAMFALARLLGEGDFFFGSWLLLAGALLAMSGAAGAWLTRESRAHSA